MPAALGAPSHERQRRHTYKHFFDLLTRNSGEWGSLPLDEVGGKTPTEKHTRIHSGARQMRLQVQTTIQAGRIYARIIEAQPKADG